MLESAAVRSFERAFAGEHITPDQERYDTALRVWDGLVDRRPALIAR
jgi:hypothetical protein